MKIVIVEDEVRIREGIHGLIDKFYKNAFEIYEACSGLEGLELVRNIKPDIVITDIRMRPMDGLSMLKTLREERYDFKAVILSAYSEFEYARQAIGLDVTDYLIKPVDIGEFQRVMRCVEAELEKEKMIKLGSPSKLRSLENILSGLVSGQLKIDAELQYFIENTYHIDVSAEIALISVYLGKYYSDESRFQVANLLPAITKSNCFTEYQLLFLQQEQELLLVFTNLKDTVRIERYWQNTVMREIKGMTDIPVVYGFTICKGLQNIAPALNNIREYLPWNISLGIDILISYPKITQVQTVELVYPIEIEKKSVDSLCRADWDALYAFTDELLQYLSIKLYHPEQIKRAIIRYILTVSNVTKEINYNIYTRLNEQKMVGEITDAKTQEELKAVVNGMLGTIIQHESRPAGPIVRKACRLVDEFYKSGITLEEISDRLSLTPDYVSMQFVKEIGVNFSTYIKRYRMNKAKELLLGTDLRVHEIATRVGYNDAKYFSKVFKECEGILPAEYRRNMFLR